MPKFNFSLNLMARVILLVSVGLLLMFGGFAYLGLEAVQESTARSLQERMLLAQITANRVDDLLRQKISFLQTTVQDMPIDPRHASAETLSPIMRTILQYFGDFGVYVAVLDSEGTVIGTEPPLPQLIGTNIVENRYVHMALKSGQPIVSGYFAPIQVDPAAAIMIPISQTNGVPDGILVAAVNLKHESIMHVLGPLGLGQRGYAEIIDEEGFPLASTSEEQSWQNCRYGDRFATLIRDRGTVVGQCHDCHSTTQAPRRQNGVMAFSALKTAPWGVVVQQDEAEAFAYTRELQNNLLLFGGSAFLITLVVAWLLTRSVVKPIHRLIDASRRIAAGDLAQPIPHLGGGEVSILASSMDDMREQLKRSLDEIQGWNQTLEHRVESRTQALREAEQDRRELVRRLVVAQEEERRSMARELHDETSQALTALAVELERVTNAPNQSVDELKRRLQPIKLMATEMLREIQRIIHDLRPAILDDLGLSEAIDWYAENRLKARGIQVALETDGISQRLPSEVETVVFRIAQEAINNVVKHANAENVRISLELEDDVVVLELEDDGHGFDPDATKIRTREKTSFGLVSIQERAALFGGTAKIESSPNEGTTITARIPLKGTRKNGHHSYSVGR